MIQSAPRGSHHHHSMPAHLDYNEEDDDDNVHDMNGTGRGRGDRGGRGSRGRGIDPDYDDDDDEEEEDLHLLSKSTPNNLCPINESRSLATESTRGGGGGGSGSRARGLGGLATSAGTTGSSGGAGSSRGGNNSMSRSLATESASSIVESEEQRAMTETALESAVAAGAARADEIEDGYVTTAIHVAARHSKSYELNSNGVSSTSHHNYADLKDLKPTKASKEVGVRSTSSDAFGNSFGYYDATMTQQEQQYSTKLVKIKVWDPSDSRAKSSIVTVAINVPTKKKPQPSNDETGDDYYNIQQQLTNATLGMGQRIHLRQTHAPNNHSNANHDREQQQQHKPVIELWQPQDNDTTIIPTKNNHYNKESSSNNRIRHRENNHAPPESPPITALYRKRNSNSTLISEITTDHNIMHSNNNSSIILNSSTINNNSSNNNHNPAANKNDGENNNHNNPTNKNTNTSHHHPNPTTSKNSSKSLEPFTIPAIHSATVVKRTPSEKIGLAFRKANGSVILEKIMPGSAFDGTPMRPGHECLNINGHRVRSARRAAEIVRESTSSLTLVVSNAARPPGTMYTMIPMKVAGVGGVGGKTTGGGGGGGGDPPEGAENSNRMDVAGMHFKMKQGLVQLVKIDPTSPISATSMRVGDFVLTVNGYATGAVADAVKLLLESQKRDNDDLIPILYFNMRQLRVSLVDKVISDLWKKEWSEHYDECVVLQPGVASKPFTLRFKEEGTCELLDPLRAFRVSKDNSLLSGGHKMSQDEPPVSPDDPLVSIVDTLNHGIVTVLAAIREGIKLATSKMAKNENGVKQPLSKKAQGDLDKLSVLYSEGLLNKEDYEAIRSRLLS